MSLASRFFRWHRWLAYLVAVQVLLWVAGGALFAWLPFQGWVKGQDAVGKPATSLPAGWAERLADAVPDDLAVLSVHSVATARGTAWRLRLSGSADRWLGADGHELPPPDAAAVQRFARQLYKGSGRFAGAERLDEVPPRLGIVREVAGDRAVWRARFDDALQTRLYFDARSGELLAVRNDAWAWYDLFFRLHVMDYAGGDDFNNNLLRLAVLAGLALVLTGAVLLVLALRRALRARR